MFEGIFTKRNNAGLGAGGFKVVAGNVADVSNTGSTTDNDVLTLKKLGANDNYIVPANSFKFSTQKIRVRGWGNVTGTAGTHTIRIKTANVDGSNVQTVLTRSMSTTAGEFEFEFEITPTSVTAQIARGRAGVSTPIMVNATTAIDFSIDKLIKIFVQNSSAADTVTIRDVILEILG